MKKILAVRLQLLVSNVQLLFQGWTLRAPGPGVGKNECSHRNKAEKKKVGEQAPDADVSTG